MQWLLAGVTWPRRWPVGAVGGLAFLAIVSGGMVAVAAANFVQGFNSGQTLQPGLVVVLNSGSSETVEAAPGGKSDRLYGVVIDPSNAPATVADEGQNVFVATSGRYPVLVSLENGELKSGDYLSISVTDGIAAKASSSHSLVVGRALESFDNSSGALTKTASGYAIGRIAVDVGIAKNPLLKNGGSVPGPLRSIGEAIAGKNVSALRLYAALVLLLATMLMAVSLLWVGVRNGIVAIGRNPLSKRLVLDSLGQILMVAMLIFIIGVFGVYLLLKL